MTENFKILAEFVKDISSETPDIQSYIFVKENISKYKLNIDITSKAIKNKKDLEKIVLCDVQNIIYPNLEKTFLNLLHNSGFPEVKLEKKIDFIELYKQKSN